MVPAKWFHAGRLKPIRLVVLHCTVSPDSRTGAEAVANYFARGERRASAHRVCDSDSTVICVKDEDTAFGAAGANSDGLHLELIGLPDQTTAQWLDSFSDAMLREAGSTIREWCAKYAIPMRWLTIAEVADGRTKGLCTHHDVSRAFPAVSTGHWDPGPNFPKQEALRLWGAGTQPPEDDDMKPTIYWLKGKDGNNHAHIVHGITAHYLGPAQLKTWREWGAPEVQAPVEPSMFLVADGPLRTG